MKKIEIIIYHFFKLHFYFKDIIGDFNIQLQLGYPHIHRTWNFHLVKVHLNDDCKSQICIETDPTYIATTHAIMHPNRHKSYSSLKVLVHILFYHSIHENR